MLFYMDLEGYIDAEYYLDSYLPVRCNTLYVEIVKFVHACIRECSFKA